MALEEAGYNVTRAINALDGLKRIYEAYPDLIIMARELPMINGEDPCIRVRQASYLPIIVLGGGEEASEIQIDPCLLKELRRVHPEWFVGTPEWDLKVRLEMAQRMYNETGLIMML